MRSTERRCVKKWRPQLIIAEQNSIGQPVIEQLTRDGLRIQPFTTTNASKAQAIEALALAFERSDIRIPNDPVLVSELVAYQAERLPAGLMRYGAPGGQHDESWPWQWRGAPFPGSIAWSTQCQTRRSWYRNSRYPTIGGGPSDWTFGGTLWRPSGAFLILSRMCCIFTASIAGKPIRLSTPLRFGHAGIGSRGSSIRRHMGGPQRMGFG
jgi:hypothetical protein